MTRRRPLLPDLVLPWTALLLFLAGAGFGRLGTTLGVVSAEDQPKKDAAKEAAPEGEEADANPLAACEDKQAKVLADAIKKISRKKNANDVLPVLEKIEGLQHKEFEKPLLKLLKHPSSLVAIKAAEMWEWRNHKKVAKKIWSATFGDRKVNKRRFEIKALVLKSWPRAGLTLSDKEFKEVEGDWRWIVGNPNPSLAPALVAIAKYVELAKDKRLCRKLAEELDEPGTNVVASDPNNPPREWWERRHKLWREAKPAAVAALKALTGQEFDKTAAAKQWFEENRKSFGFDW